MVKVNENNSNSFVRICKGILIAIVITIILLIIFAAILTYTNINESTMPTVVIIVTGISILIGSEITTGKIKKNGIVNGALVGSLYIMLLYIISSMVTKNFYLNSYSIIMLITSILIGGLGGVIGVNKK